MKWADIKKRVVFWITLAMILETVIMLWPLACAASGNGRTLESGNEAGGGEMLIITNILLVIVTVLLFWAALSQARAAKSQARAANKMNDILITQHISRTYEQEFAKLDTRVKEIFEKQSTKTLDQRKTPEHVNAR